MGSTMSCLRILANSSFSLSSKATGIFLAGITTGVIFWSIVMWQTLGSVPLSPKQSLYSFKKLRFWELEVDSILLIRFNCLLEFSPVMGGKFVSVTINNKGTFLQRCLISKVNCPFTGILLPLYELRVVINFAVLDFVCRVSMWFSGITLTWAPESIL